MDQIFQIVAQARLGVLNELESLVEHKFNELCFETEESSAEAIFAVGQILKLINTKIKEAEQFLGKP